MKKSLAFLSALVLLLTACSGQGQGKTTDDSSTTETEKIEYAETRMTDFSPLLTSGRIITDGDGLHLDWTYSGFTLNGWFNGKIEAEVSAVGHKAQLGYLLHITVDGDDRVTRYGLDEKKITLADVAEGYHTITVRKTTEGCITTMTVKALTFTGKADHRPAAPEMRLEVIGDSITIGQGSRKDDDGKKPFDYIDDCDSYNSYASMTARKLGADINFVAVSGWGVIKGSESPDNRIPDIYGYTSYMHDRTTGWDFSSYQPDVVVIALGTNDGGAQNFGVAADSFLKTVREKNPDAYIVWIYGMMNDYLKQTLKDTVAAQNDPKISYLDMEADTDGGWGHPSYSAQCGYAEKLTAHIKSLTA